MIRPIRNFDARSMARRWKKAITAAGRAVAFWPYITNSVATEAMEAKGPACELFTVVTKLISSAKTPFFYLVFREFRRFWQGFLWPARASVTGVLSRAIENDVDRAVADRGSLDAISLSRRVACGRRGSADAH